MPLNWGAGFDALAQAMQYYQAQKQQQFENTRQLAGDQRANEQLALQRNADLRAGQQQDFAQTTSKRAAALNLAKMFGGQAVPAGGPVAKEFGAAGYGDLLTPEQTAVQDIGGRHLTGGILPVDTPTEPSGNVTIPDPQDDAMQRALLSAQMKYYTTNANNASREGIQGANRASRESIANKQMAVRQAISNNALAMQRYGIDVRSADQMRALEQLIDANTAHFNDVENDNFTNSLRANPLAFLPYITGQQRLPPPIAPNYFSPQPNPGMTAPASPGRGTGVGGPGATSSRYSVIEQK